MKRKVIVLVGFLLAGCSLIGRGQSTPPATATLPTAGLSNFHTSQVRGLTEQCARRDAHRLLDDIKGDRVLSHARSLLPPAPSD